MSHNIDPGDLNKDGGPAFPVPVLDFDIDRCGEGWSVNASDDPTLKTGMTLRDYFAGQVVAGIVADPACSMTKDGYAAFAYSTADAMLRARKEGAS